MKNAKVEKSKQRDRVLNLLDKGWDSQRIVSKYPELTIQQVAAYKAWRTMGKY